MKHALAELEANVANMHVTRDTCTRCLREQLGALLYPQICCQLVMSM